MDQETRIMEGKTWACDEGMMWLTKQVDTIGMVGGNG